MLTKREVVVDSSTVSVPAHRSENLRVMGLKPSRVLGFFLFQWSHYSDLKQVP